MFNTLQIDPSWIVRRALPSFTNQYVCGGPIDIINDMYYSGGGQSSDIEIIGDGECDGLTH